MRQVLNGLGQDTSQTVATYLAAGKSFQYANLYLIGDYDDPQAVRLTDWESPLCWPIWGTFTPGIIQRGSIDSKIGLEVSDLAITWTPKLTAPTASIYTANPYQLAQAGYYDNKLFRCWTAFMPYPGDCNTFGAAAMFGGRIGQSEIQRGKIVFTVNSFLDVINEMVPTNVVELLNTKAGYRGATPPAGHVSVPQFQVNSGSSPSQIFCTETSPNAGFKFANQALAGAFIVFNGGTGATLAGVLRRILSNFTGVLGNQLNLYEALPWAPTPAIDTFYVSAAAPLNNSPISGATINNGGTGYVVGDVLQVVGGGGTGGTVQVTTIGGGGTITAIGVSASGTGYAASTGALTTGGTGSGATVNITIDTTYAGFPYVPQPAGTVIG